MKPFLKRKLEIRFLHIKVEYIYQQLGLPEGYTVPEGRVSPGNWSCNSVL